ncbi:MAG TPA: aminotransferase class V-fold PLP-dependent enzyme [Roseiflexaceae bacterium]|nr:aminotransferase class V-fold PLP-dependent enzyme [Roseiflexaceae bacterium]
MSAPEPLLQTLRAREFPLTAEVTYLNAATQGPLPSTTCRAIEEAVRRAQFPDTARAPVDQPVAEVARARLAHLLGVSTDDLAFTANTTTGLNICARGIDWRPGDNVVLPDPEFPSLTYTWLQLRELGVEVRQVPWDGDGPRVDTLMAAVDRRTRAVSCSAVAWDTGYRIDLEALGRRCAAAGCLLVVDGIQAVGAVELDLRALRVSALALHGYKWLLAGFGTGALYVAPEALDRIRPRFVGEQSFLSDDDPAASALAWQPGARRYTVGGANTLGLTALAASLALIEQVGMPAIAAHNRALGALLVNGLRRHAPLVRLVSPADAARRAAIVTFTLGDVARDGALVDRLAEQGIVVARRPRGVRVAPHFYNTAAEVERLLAAIPHC